ncbi:hypothetical protein AGMMS49975_05790 [Clostridia bacterium]|nr:hypothetical protein AGMMS49975_05790 [Clostridia bacterium]
MNETTIITICVSVAVMAFVLFRQLRTKPVKGKSTILIVLAALGIYQVVIFLSNLGEDSTVTFGAVALMFAGSAALAVIMAFLRVPSYKLWFENGTAYRKGTALSVCLWIVAYALHAGYDKAVVLIDPGLEGIVHAVMPIYSAISLGVQRVLLTKKLSEIGEKSA